jgi:hypothetical protein
MSAVFVSTLKSEYRQSRDLHGPMIVILLVPGRKVDQEAGDFPDQVAAFLHFNDLHCISM